MSSTQWNLHSPPLMRLGAGRTPVRATRIVSHVLALLGAHLRRSAQRESDRVATFECVDSLQMDRGDFHASESLGLDGAPSMAFMDTMPCYARHLDRPSRG